MLVIVISSVGIKRPGCRRSGSEFRPPDMAVTKESVEVREYQFGRLRVCSERFGSL